jgi:hypothetical protein
MGDNGEGGERMVIGVKQKKGVAFNLLTGPYRIEIEASPSWLRKKLVPAVFAEQELVATCRLCREPHDPKRFVIRADAEHAEQAAEKLAEIRRVLKRLTKK